MLNRLLYPFFSIILFVTTSFHSRAQITEMNGLAMYEHTSLERVFSIFGEPDSLIFHVQIPRTGQKDSIIHRIYRENDYGSIFWETKPRNYYFQRIDLFYQSGDITLQTNTTDGHFERYENHYSFTGFWNDGSSWVLGKRADGKGVRVGDSIERLRDFILKSDKIDHDLLRREKLDVFGKARRPVDNDWDKPYGESRLFLPGWMSDDVWVVYVKDGIITAFSFYDRGEL